MKDRSPDNITLCFPDKTKSCFACCPPIRPRGYEHIDYRLIIARMLRENTLNFPKIKRDIVPITGFSCWALGYLDRNYKLIGCLLHPMHNNGRDLRYRIDYGEKCQRESCWEAGVFEELSLNAKHFWLGLCDKMDSFQYSSRRHNFLFRVLGWGNELLEQIAAHEPSLKLTKELLFQRYPFFQTQLHARGHAYIVVTLVRKSGVLLLKEPGFKTYLEKCCYDLKQQLCPTFTEPSQAPYTHLLDFDGVFLDFLRLGLGIRKINREIALKIKHRVDDWLEEIAFGF